MGFSSNTFRQTKGGHKGEKGKNILKKILSMPVYDTFDCELFVFRIAELPRSGCIGWAKGQGPRAR